MLKLLLCLLCKLKNEIGGIQAPFAERVIFGVFGFVVLIVTVFRLPALCNPFDRLKAVRKVILTDSSQADIEIKVAVKIVAFFQQLVFSFAEISAL